jgi:hypothetical protein
VLHKGESRLAVVCVCVSSSVALRGVKECKENEKIEVRRKSRKARKFLEDRGNRGGDRGGNRGGNTG